MNNICDNTTTQQTVFALTYGSYIAEENESYCECLGVFRNRIDAIEQLKRDFDFVLKNDFDSYEKNELRYYCNDTSFMVSSLDGDTKSISENIKEVRIR